MRQTWLRKGQENLLPIVLAEAKIPTTPSPGSTATGFTMSSRGYTLDPDRGDAFPVRFDVDGWLRSPLPPIFCGPARQDETDRPCRFTPSDDRPLVSSDMRDWTRYPYCGDYAVEGRATCVGVLHVSGRRKRFWQEHLDPRALNYE
jgi:hypothetical protein